MINKDIQDIHTGQTRTDGRYPQRVGATVSFCLYPSVGSCLYCMYLFRCRRATERRVPENFCGDIRF